LGKTWLSETWLSESKKKNSDKESEAVPMMQDWIHLAATAASQDRSRNRFELRDET